MSSVCFFLHPPLPASVDQSDAYLICDQEVLCSIPARSGVIFHEIFSTVILSPPLIQEGQLSVSGERMCTNTG